MGSIIGAVTAVIITASLVLALVCAGALVFVYRLYQDSVRRTDEALAAIGTERARYDAQQQALQRYEVAFSSVSGRGELGEQVLVETARALGLRRTFTTRCRPTWPAVEPCGRTWC